MTKKRLGIAMIDLVVTIVVIGIVLLAVPNIQEQAFKSSYAMHDSKLIEELYSKVATNMQVHAQGGVGVTPIDGSFGSKSIRYNPYKSAKGKSLRLIRDSLSTQNGKSQIVMHGFSLDVAVERVSRGTSE